MTAPPPPSLPISTAPLDPTPPPARRQRIARITLSLVLFALGLWIVHGFFEALAWAGVIAIAISPLYARLDRRWPRLKRHAVLPALVTLAVALIVLVPIALGLFRAIAEAQDVAGFFVGARENGIAVPAWLGRLPFGGAAAVGWWQAHLATPEGAHAQFARLDNQSLMYHGRLIWWSALHRAVTFFFMLLTLFFVLRDCDTLVAQFRGAGQRLLGPSSERIGRQVVQSVRGTIDGLVLVGIGEGAVMTIVYASLGVPHAILLGIATAVAAMIPFGAALVFAIAAFTLLVQDAVPQAIAVIAIGLAVVGIADHFIRPVLIGGATRLPFLWVLIGILGGVETLGLLGLFVGPATMAVLVMLWRELLEHDGGAVPTATDQRSP